MSIEKIIDDVKTDPYIVRGDRFTILLLAEIAKELRGLRIYLEENIIAVKVEK